MAIPSDLLEWILQDNDDKIENDFQVKTEKVQFTLVCHHNL